VPEIAMSEIVLPRSLEYSAFLPAAPELVFDYLDDFTHLGAHMARANWMMAGSRVAYEFDAGKGRAIGGLVRLTGSILGIPIRIEERVTDRDRPFGKAWHTVGRPRMLVMDAYRMGFSVVAVSGGSRLKVYIDYVEPRRGIGRVLGAVFAGTYARWCVRSMVKSAVAQFGTRAATPSTFRDPLVRGRS
jgi:hypothetical protein